MQDADTAQWFEDPRRVRRRRSLAFAAAALAAVLAGVSALVRDDWHRSAFFGALAALTVTSAWNLLVVRRRAGLVVLERATGLNAYVHVGAAREYRRVDE